MAKKFTAKRQRFIDSYDGNATKAAKKAGYANPRRQGNRLLTNVDILSAIQEREKKRAKGPIANREERQEFWTKAMRNTDIDIKDRLKSSELMGKSEADFTEKIEQSGDLVVKIVRFSE